MAKLDTYGKISFLYFDDLESACNFFENTLQLELTCDQGWSKIYRVCQGGYIGAVDRSRGACDATTRDCVLTSLVVKNHDEMVKRLESAGIEFSYKPHYSESLEIKSLMFVGPEGYMFEVEEFLSKDDKEAFYGEKSENMIDEFSKTIGIMSAFAEVVACGAKNMALGVPVYDKDLRDKHFVYAEEIARKRGIYCKKEDEGFLTDLFPVEMNKDKYNILLYKDQKALAEFNHLKDRKEQLLKKGEYKGDKRFQVAYDFGILLSYDSDDIKRMIKENTDLENI